MKIAKRQSYPFNKYLLNRCCGSGVILNVGDAWPNMENPLLVNTINSQEEQ